MRNILVPTLALLIIAKVAFAQAPERQAFRVEVAVPQGCTAIFIEELQSKTKNVDLSGHPDATSLLRVRVVKSGAAFNGSLDIETAGSAPVRRVLQGETCGEVLRGLALVAAVTIDPPAAPSEGSADASADAPEPRSHPPLGEPPLPAPAAELPDAPDASAPPPTRPSRVSVAIGGGAEVTSLVPDATPLFSGFGELGAIGSGPKVRLRFGASLPADVASRSGNASLAWLAGSGDVCPLGAGLTADLFLRPCLGVTLGALRARGAGTGVAIGETRSRFWAAGRLLARLDGHIGPFTFGADAGAILPITREQLVFRPPPGTSSAVEPVYEPPAVAGFAGIDVGVRFR